MQKVPASFNIQVSLPSSNEKARFKVKTRRDCFFCFKQSIKLKCIIGHEDKIKMKKKKKRQKSEKFP